MSSKIQVKNNKYPKTVIIEEILKIFPNLKACADALGMTESNFSHAISRRSNKFIFRLKDIGVKFPPIAYDFTLSAKNTLLKEPDTRYEDCLKEIESLKNELVESRKLLTLSVNRITEVEKENEQLRVKCAALLKANGGKGSNNINNKL